jgi:hypothetical protein
MKRECWIESKGTKKKRKREKNNKIRIKREESYSRFDEWRVEDL